MCPPALWLVVDILADTPHFASVAESLIHSGNSVLFCLCFYQLTLDALLSLFLVRKR